MHITEDIIYFPLDVSNEIDIAYDRDLKSLLTAMYNNGEYEIMVRI